MKRILIFLIINFFYFQFNCCQLYKQEYIFDDLLDTIYLKDHKKIPEQLSLTNFNVNYVSDEGFGGLTLLHYAVALASKEIVETLILHKANVNCQSLNYVTPLAIASIIKNIDIAHILVENGARVSFLNEKSEELFRAACFLERLKLINEKYIYYENLTEDSSWLLRFKSGWIIGDLVYDAEDFLNVLFGSQLSKDIMLDNNVHNIAKILKSNAEVNKSGKTGMTPLMWAVLKGNHEIIKLLLEYQPKVEQRSFVRFFNFSQIDLTQNRVDVSQTNLFGETAPMLAIKHNKNHLANMILDAIGSHLHDLGICLSSAKIPIPIGFLIIYYLFGEPIKKLIVI